MKRNQRYTMKQVYDSSNMNAGVGPTPINNNPFTIPGPVDSLLIRVITNLTIGTGAIAAAATLSEVISNLQLNDKNNGVILNSLGTDLQTEQFVRSFLDSRYMENDQRNWENVSDLAMAAGAQEQDYLLKLPIKQKDLQLKIQGFIAGLSTYLSTVGTATMSVDIQIIAICYTDDPAWTQRSQKTNMGSSLPVANANDISKLLPDGIVIDLVVLYVGTDSYITGLTLDPTGTNTGIVAIQQAALKGGELLRSHYAVAALGSRLPGVYVLDVGSFMKTDQTKFTVDVATGFTPYAFILFHHVTDTPTIPTARNNPPQK